MNISDSRIRRAAKTRKKIAEQSKPRLTLFKSSKNIYAQLFDARGTQVIASASTNEKEIKSDHSNIESAKEVGKRLAERAISAGVTSVVFDRSGYRYHGKVKALAESAREAGLEF
ncbi:MAG: 50S ribosomal protein L18 [Gammaproteobacteria bacterium]